MPATLAELVSDDRVEFDDLHRRYGPVLNMVNVLIGVVPNCDQYLEIWPAGFRTYNLMVPNFLDLPAMLLGRGAPKDLVGLGMYASSRAASCAYCSAHTCSFALRRGSSADAVTGAERTESEQAVVDLAESLSTMPHHYDSKFDDRLVSLLGRSDAEWIALGVAMMGFLNKFMDAMGVDLEPEAVGDVAELIEPTGWSIGQHGWAGVQRPNGAPRPPTDTLRTMLRVARNAPGAVRLDREWSRGLPKDASALRQHVATNYGYDEPLLSAMGHAKPARALAAMLCHNLDPAQSELTIGTKALTGLVFATTAGNEHLQAQARALAEHGQVAPDIIEAAAGFVPGTDDDRLDPETTAALTMAAAIAPSPAVVDDSVIELVGRALSSAQTIELAVWVSVCQLLHRMSLYHGLAD